MDAREYHPGFFPQTPICIFRRYFSNLEPNVFANFWKTTESYFKISLDTAAQWENRPAWRKADIKRILPLRPKKNMPISWALNPIDVLHTHTYRTFSRRRWLTPSTKLMGCRMLFELCTFLPYAHDSKTPWLGSGHVRPNLTVSLSNTAS